MAGYAWSFALLLAIISAPPALAADTLPFDGIPNLKFAYYDVEGRTSAEIYSSMKARAPSGARDGSGVARTDWHIKVGWREVRRGRHCAVSDPLSSLSITIHLPRLIDMPNVSAEGMAFWRSAIAGLEIHEAGHARIAWEHRNDFNRAAQKADCKTVRGIAEQTKARIVAIQAAYDRETRHGITQTPPIQ